jgi:hypothetical protein
MRSLIAILDQLKPPSLALSALTDAFEQDSIRGCIAQRDISDTFRRTGGKFGPLGPLSGPLEVAVDGSYQQNFQLGRIDLLDIDVDCDARRMFQAAVTLVGIRCFAAQDVETDELFGTVSLINVNPNFSSQNELIETVPLPLTPSVSGDFHYKETLLGTVPLTGSGLVIHTTLWDNESGAVGEIREKVQEMLREGAKKGASALGAGAIAGDPSVTSGAVGDFTEFEIGGVKPFEIVTASLAGVIAGWLADDLMGEQRNVVPTGSILEFRGAGYNNSLRMDPALDFDARFNWPPPGHDITFSKGGALYKAYFKIQAFEAIMPCEPKLL